MELAARVERTHQHFAQVHKEVFAGDPAANPRLTVEVLEPSEVEGVHTLVLITPWTVNGMFFPEARTTPPSLEIGGRHYPVFCNELTDIGRYCAVNLLADVSWATMKTVFTALEPLVPWFRDSIRRTYSASDVADPARRALLFGGRAQ